MSLPNKPEQILADINMRYYNGELPKVASIRFVEDLSEGEFIDTRCDSAAVLETQEGWVMEINATLKGSPRLLYQTMAHEAVHLRYPKAKHRSKEWNREVRRLQGLGLFLRTF